MASTQPAPLTLLRVKRARAHSALDAVHIHLPKRARTEASDTRFFRRLPAAADIDTLGPSRVVDIDPTLLRKHNTSPPVETAHPIHAAHFNSAGDNESPDNPKLAESDILYNGVPLEREFVDDEYMFDIFAEDRAESREMALDGDNIAWVSGEDLPIFDWDSESEEEGDESDEERSVDYPSTPEKSIDSDAFEDEWRERERRFCESDGDETETGVEKFYGYGMADSEGDGDCFDYDA